MEKVAGLQYMNVPVSATHTPFSGPVERSPMIRGHHSSVNKAVDAHRQMVEQRQSRHFARGQDSGQTSEFSNADLIVAQQVSSDEQVGDEYNMYENTLIELPATQAKVASIQSFQSSEPERPTLGEPVPKGSYLDIQA